jgi:hypothetical protein
MRVTAGIFLASILLKEMHYLVYIRYLWACPYEKSLYESEFPIGIPIFVIFSVEIKDIRKIIKKSSIRKGVPQPLFTQDQITLLM